MIVTVITETHTKAYMIMENEIVTLAYKISDLYDELGTWEKVGEYYGVPKIVLWRIVNDGYEPKKNRIRCLLGLSEIIEQRRRRDPKGRFVKDIG